MPLPILAMGASLVQAGQGAAKAYFTNAPPTFLARAQLRALTAFLYLLQPLARLRGRLDHGLSIWRWRGSAGFAFPWVRTFKMWSEHWQASEERLRFLEAVLRELGAVVRRGGDYDRWDLEVRGGPLSAVRIIMAVEEHGGGRQLVRFRTWPRSSRIGLVFTPLCAILAAWATIDRVWASSMVLWVITLMLGIRGLQQCATAMAAILHALKQQGPEGTNGRV
jgi:hypothetical protein